MTKNGSILLVDDDEFTLNAIRRLLGRELVAITVSDGAAALKLMKEERFAVVLTDLMMPGMTGYELINRLETDYPETICVVLSGQVGEAFPTRTPKNVFRCLNKPCSVDDLVSALHGAFAEYILRHPSATLSTDLSEVESSNV